MGCTLPIRQTVDLKPFEFCRRKKTFLASPRRIIPRVSSLRPGRSWWPLLCDWINPRAWDNGHVTATGRMWQENNQPATVPFQSRRRWSFRHRKRDREREERNMFLRSFCSTHEMRIKIKALTGDTSAICSDLGFLEIFFARWGKVLACFFFPICIEKSWKCRQQVCFGECVTLLLVWSDWQRSVLSKRVWLASWDRNTLCVQRTGSSSQLGMKHNCVYPALAGSWIVNLYFLLRTYAWAAVWVLWTLESELQKQKVSC